MSGIRAQAAASLALLRDGVASRSPQAAGSKYECTHGPTAQPARYYLFDRSEVNRVTLDAYNRVTALGIVGDVLHVHVDEDSKRPGANTLFRSVVRIVDGGAGWMTRRLRHAATRLDALIARGAPP